MSDQTQLTDEQKADLNADLAGPKSVAADGIVVTNRSAEEILAIQDRECTKEATAKRKSTGVRITAINSPGSVNRT